MFSFSTNIFFSGGNSQCEELEEFPHNINVDDGNTAMPVENKITTREKRYNLLIHIFCLMV